MGKTDIETIERNKIPMKTEFTCINYNCNCKYKANLGEQRKYFSRWGKGEKHTEGCSIKYFDEIGSEPNLAKFKVEKRLLEDLIGIKIHLVQYHKSMNIT